jgi:hypothetical protein
MTDWRHTAGKAEEDELFFPHNFAVPALLQIAETKGVRRGRPVVTEHLRWVLVVRISSAGGMSELHVRVAGMSLTLAVLGARGLDAGLVQ